MQLARVKNDGGTTRIESGGGGGGDGNGNNRNSQQDASEGGRSGSSSGGPADTTDGVSWVVAVAAPVPPLHGFCLAVVGLETGTVGAAVTLVDRSVEATAKQAAVGFLGFDKVGLRGPVSLCGVFLRHPRPTTTNTP